MAESNVIVDTFNKSTIDYPLPSFIEQFKVSQSLELVDVLSVGPIEEVESYLMNDTKVDNYTGVSAFYRLGKTTESGISRNNSLDENIEINSELKYDKDFIRSIDLTDVDKLSLFFLVPSLYDGQNTDHNERYEVTLKVEIKEDSKTSDWFTLLDCKRYIGRLSQYSIQETFDLAQEFKKQNILLRVRKREGVRKTSNSNDTIYLQSIKKSFSISPNYPGSAYVYSLLDSDLVQGTPSRKYIIKGLQIKIPHNYDPVTRTYEGRFNGTFKIAYSNNPIWVIMDMLVNTNHGLGNRFSESDIDIWSFYKVAQYCDELIDGKPRHTINVTITQHESPKSLIEKMTSAIFSKLYYKNGYLSINIDRKKDPILLIDDSDILRDSFSEKSSELSTRSNIIIAEYVDEAQNFKDIKLRISDENNVALYGEQITDFSCFGITNREEATRLALYYLYSNLFESKNITFSLGFKGAKLRIGDIFVLDDSKKNTSIKTDLTVDGLAHLPNAIEFTAFYHTNDDLVKVVGNKEELSKLDEPNAILFLSSSQIRYFRVDDIQVEKSKNTYTITAQQHFPQKFKLIEAGEYSPEIIKESVSRIKTATFIHAFKTDIDSNLININVYPLNSQTYRLRYRVKDSKDNVLRDWEEIPDAKSKNVITMVISGVYQFEALTVFGSFFDTPLSGKEEKEFALPLSSPTILNVFRTLDKLFIKTSKNTTTVGTKNFIEFAGEIKEAKDIDGSDQSFMIFDVASDLASTTIRTFNRSPYGGESSSNSSLENIINKEFYSEDFIDIDYEWRLLGSRMFAFKPLPSFNGIPIQIKRWVNDENTPISKRGEYYAVEQLQKDIVLSSSYSVDLGKEKFMLWSKSYNLSRSNFDPSLSLQATATRSINNGRVTLVLKILDSGANGIVKGYLIKAVNGITSIIKPVKDMKSFIKAKGDGASHYILNYDTPENYQNTDVILVGYTGDRSEDQLPTITGYNETNTIAVSISDGETNHPTNMSLNTLRGTHDRYQINNQITLVEQEFEKSKILKYQITLLPYDLDDTWISVEKKEITPNFQGNQMKLTYTRRYPFKKVELRKIYRDGSFLDSSVTSDDLTPDENIKYVFTEPDLNGWLRLDRVGDYVNNYSVYVLNVNGSYIKHDNSGIFDNTWFNATSFRGQEISIGFRVICIGADDTIKLFSTRIIVQVSK